MKRLPNVPQILPSYEPFQFQFRQHLLSTIVLGDLGQLTLKHRAEVLLEGMVSYEARRMEFGGRSIVIPGGQSRIHWFHLTFYR